MVEQGSKKKLADGRYEIRFAIDAVGMLLVPEFILNCKTQNNAEIIKFDIKGKMFSKSWDINDKSSWDKTTVVMHGDNRMIGPKTMELKETQMEPEDIEVVVTTYKDPGNPLCSVYPMKYVEEENEG